MEHIIEHKDIYILSYEALSWKQYFDEDLNYEDLYINKPNYADYRPTRLQFHITSAVIQQPIKIKIPYDNRLNETHAKYAVVCRYDEPRKQWTILSHYLNKEEHTIEFEANAVGIFTVFLNHYWYSSLTQRLADEYPMWTKIRQSKDSNGQLFLNYFGMELEAIHDYLNWIEHEKFIQTADLTSYDWIYMYTLPIVKSTDTIRLTRTIGGSTTEIPILETLQEFFYNERNTGGIIDYEESRLYSSRDYGSLEVAITRGEDTTVKTIQSQDYHMWNTFDEFGLLLGVKRLHLEKNADFKERILDVFRYSSGAHDLGLSNGIGRELNLIKRHDYNGKKMIWKDDSKNLYLRNRSGYPFDVRTLRIDDQPLQEDQFTVDERGDIFLLPMNTGRTHTVSIITGIEKYELHNSSDMELHKQIYKEDGQATSKLLSWVQYINTIAPVMWGRIRWDEGYWDTIDKQLTGLGYVPNIWDSDMSIWKDYIFESER